MRASEIRSAFLNFFSRHGHTVVPSSSLVPANDPTLLFVNAGMVQFKKMFLGLEEPVSGRRAVTSQKCVRAGGKHNDLEQVGHTARHHTFFEMLGNFSFGDYFKREAIGYGWDFVTKELKIPAKYLRVTVFREDDEARALWREVAGLSDSRIYGLDEKDNFWQMADTGPCGPCSEIYVDLAHLAKDWAFPPNASGEWADLQRDEFSLEAFVEGAEAGRFLEIWNLVFMQFDRQQDGTLVPLPKPSVDTGAGLERIAAVMQGVTSNFHIDLFVPLIERIEEIVGIHYRGRETSEPYIMQRTFGNRAQSVTVDPASFRVLADHARAVAFLLADGVFPSNEGRGYVLRRILRRAVRHAWLLGRREPTLVRVVESVVATMSNLYPELQQRKTHILETTRAEEERFLATIDGGMRRFDEVAPAHSTQGSSEVRGTISGEDAFRLYDTFGFPIDLTDLMARERGYTVDIAGFEAALGQQRQQSQEERKAKKLTVAADQLGTGWETPNAQGGTAATTLPATDFKGYERVEIETQVTAVRRLPDGRVAILLRETPFYAESGGQVSDQGEIVGDGWRVDVDEVRKVDGRIAAVGRVSGELKFSRATARVPGDRRHDTQRNHTATHLLHAALRNVLGDHVHQAGSLVAPDRLRFDFTHHGPVKPEALEAIERQVNHGIWDAHNVETRERPYSEAVAAGAMALFGEKYGDVVRVVSVPGISVELCGGTHVRNTSEIALFRILSETGVAAGVRRIEALTGPRAFEHMREHERTLQHASDLVKGTPETLIKRVQALIDERRALERRLTEGGAGGPGSDRIRQLVAGAERLNGVALVAATVVAGDVRELQALGDALREQLAGGVAALGATFEDGKTTLLVVVSDDARDRGIRADALIKDVAAAAGGRGGGKPHMAQAGIPDAGLLPQAYAALGSSVRQLLAGGA